MRLQGWCETCHRIRPVNVRRLIPGTVQTGICSSCEQDKREKPLRDRMVVVGGEQRTVHLTTHRGLTVCGKTIQSRAPYPMQLDKTCRCTECFKEKR